LECGEEASLPVRYRKSEKLALGVVIDQTALERLVKLLTDESLGEPSYLVDLADGAQATCDTLAEVLTLPNTGSHRIKEIVITTPQEANAGVTIAFRGTPFEDDTVYYAVNGDERTAYHLARRIEEFAATIRAWYSGATTWGLSAWLIVLLASALLVQWAFKIQIPTIDPFAWKWPIWALNLYLRFAWVLAFAFVGAFLGGAYLLDLLTKYLFPPIGSARPSAISVLSG
jgi:hypothetical protein